MAAEEIEATRALFKLGTLVATPAAQALVSSEESGTTAMKLFTRHATGDWGDLCEEDKVANYDALKDGTRILSAYKLPNGKVWIITEADRSVTTILKPEEY